MIQTTIAPSTHFKEYTTFPVLLATLIADLGETPNAIEVVVAGTLVVKQMDGTSRTFTAVAANTFRPMQVSEITSATGGKVIAYRSAV